MVAVWELHMTMPNFLILGTSHAGTTSLYSYLEQHPDIFMSANKEPAFFIFNAPEMQSTPKGANKISDLAAYQALFANVQAEKAIGEATAAYLYEKAAVPCIKHYIPDAKLIMILRDPVERAFSHYLHMYLTHPDAYLEEFVQGFKSDRIKTCRFVQMGFYAPQITRYFEAFSREQIKIILFDDLVTDTIRVTQDVYAFLGVDCTVVPDLSLLRNKSGIPSSPLLKALMPYKHSLKKIFPTRKLRDRIKQKILVKPELPADIRQQLIPTYQQDILETQTLIQRDLSSWLR